MIRPYDEFVQSYRDATASFFALSCSKCRIVSLSTWRLTVGYLDVICLCDWVLCSRCALLRLSNVFCIPCRTSPSQRTEGRRFDCLTSNLLVFGVCSKSPLASNNGQDTIHPLALIRRSSLQRFKSRLRRSQGNVYMTLDQYV